MGFTFIHRNLSFLPQVYQSDTNVYIVLELAPNGELFDYVNKHVKLPEKTTCMLMEQLFQGHYNYNVLIKM